METEIGDELMAVDVATGSCFGFNAVASRAWRMLAEPLSFEDLHKMLISEFAVQPAQCASELKELLDDMIAKDLIEKMS